jgi:hypothetical protein
MQEISKEKLKGALAKKGKWHRDYSTVPTKLLSVGFKDKSQ